MLKKITEKQFILESLRKIVVKLKHQLVIQYFLRSGVFSFGYILKPVPFGTSDLLQILSSMKLSFQRYITR